jgi:hypothetical protein
MLALIREMGRGYLLDHNVGVSSSDTFDFGQCEHDLLFSVNVGVEETKNVLECILIGDYKSHDEMSKGVQVGSAR